MANSIPAPFRLVVERRRNMQPALRGVGWRNVMLSIAQDVLVGDLGRDPTREETAEFLQRLGGIRVQKERAVPKHARKLLKRNITWFAELQKDKPQAVAQARKDTPPITVFGKSFSGIGDVLKHYGHPEVWWRPKFEAPADPAAAGREIEDQLFEMSPFENEALRADIFATFMLPIPPNFDSYVEAFSSVLRAAQCSHRESPRDTAHRVLAHLSKQVVTIGRSQFYGIACAAVEAGVSPLKVFEQLSRDLPPGAARDEAVSWIIRDLFGRGERMPDVRDPARQEYTFGAVRTGGAPDVRDILGLPSTLRGFSCGPRDPLQRDLYWALLMDLDYERRRASVLANQLGLSEDITQFLDQYSRRWIDNGWPMSAEDALEICRIERDEAEARKVVFNGVTYTNFDAACEAHRFKDKLVHEVADTRKLSKLEALQLCVDAWAALRGKRGIGRTELRALLRAGDMELLDAVAKWRAAGSPAKTKAKGQPLTAEEIEARRVVINGVHYATIREACAAHPYEVSLVDAAARAYGLTKPEGLQLCVDAWEALGGPRGKITRKHLRNCLRVRHPKLLDAVTHWRAAHAVAKTADAA